MPCQLRLKLSKLGPTITTKSPEKQIKCAFWAFGPHVGIVNIIFKDFHVDFWIRHTFLHIPSHLRLKVSKLGQTITTESPKKNENARSGPLGQVWAQQTSF
jgi:predicted transcriptional regulator